MKIFKLILLLNFFWLVGCGQGFKVSASNGQNLSNFNGDDTTGNVIPVHVSCGYVNEPCVSVTICVPGTTQCQTINNLLLDTGSYGLRIFSSATSLALPQQTDSIGKSIAQCVSYADGTSHWGPVKMADVKMADEVANNLPIQIIDAQFGTIPSDCTDAETSPAQAGFNGILGVGLFTEDCGIGCVTSANNRIYFACSGTTCAGAAVALNKQVANPVSFFPIDNNGVVLDLPAVSSSGAVSVTGSLYFGIGTKQNNTPQGVTTFPADANGNFKTQFNGHNYTAFIDSGSNGLYFPGTTALPECTNLPGFYCPTSLQNLTAIQTGANASPQETISFQVMNASTALSSSNPNYVFNNLGGSFASAFDWGLPFFLGRKVYVAIEDTNSPLGGGRLWAH